MCPIINFLIHFNKVINTYIDIQGERERAIINIWGTFVKEEYENYADLDYNI